MGYVITYQFTEINHRHNRFVKRKRKFKKDLQIDCERLKGYFPQKYTTKQCEDLLWKIFDEWKKHM